MRIRVIGNQAVRDVSICNGTATKYDAPNDYRRSCQLLASIVDVYLFSARSEYPRRDTEIQSEIRTPQREPDSTELNVSGRSTNADIFGDFRCGALKRAFIFNRRFHRPLTC